VGCYQLEQKSAASPVCKVLCNVLSVFGKEAALQEWGFEEDFKNNTNLRAVCFGGRWFLIEKEDVIEVITPSQVPFQEISLALHNKDGVMVQAYKRQSA